MINKKLFKKNYILFISMFIAICFSCILGNSLRVNAYHLNEETGNLVSDNLISFECDLEINGVSVVCDGSNITFNGIANDWSKFNIDTNYISTDFYFRVTLASGSVTYNDGLLWFDPINADNNETQGGYNINNSIGIVSEQYIQPVNAFNIVIDEGLVFNDFSLNVMALPTDNISSYEPYGEVFYSQSNYDNNYNNGFENGIGADYQEGYDNGYSKGYQEGYDKGYLENNSIPNIYISSATYIYRTNLSGAEVVYNEVGSLIGGFSGVLDFSFAFTYDYPIFAYSGQSPTLTVGLLTSISVDDILKFDLSNIDLLSNSQMVAITFLGGDNLSVSLTYQQIIDNNYGFSLKDVYPDISFSEFYAFIINYRYNGDDILSGIRSITDVSFTMDSNEQYDLGYKVGYITGKNDGLVNGEEIGYDKGYSEGYKKASQVVSKPGNNTLVGMVGTLIETPVNMFIDIFNFEFLGVNLVAFFFSLLTLIIVVWLIKYLK